MDDNNLSFIECAATTGVSPGASRDTEIRNFGPVRVDAIQQITIEQLESHSSHPRLILREDVVEVIRAEIAEHGFRNEHALVVRPLGDKFQIISGHQRTEAARRAKLKTVPCWVREMSDEEALMQLVLSNAQGELSGLEYGIHALTVVGKAEPGRGKKGGYSKYARQIGKDASLVSRLALGAEVFGAVKSLTRVNDLMDWARHLAAIHAADKRAWSVLVDAMLKGEWSLKDTERRITDVAKFDIPENSANWLPYEDVVHRYLSANFGPVTVNRLVEEAEATITMIANLGGTEDDRLKYVKWLVDNRGGPAWDFRQLVAKREELLCQLRARLAQVEKEREESWLLGNWRDHVDKLEDGSVTVLLTDPPYGIGYKSKRHDKIANDKSPERALAEFEAALQAFYPKLAENAQVFVFCDCRNYPDFRGALERIGCRFRGLLYWVKNCMGQGDLSRQFGPMVELIIHANKGTPILYKRVAEAFHADRVSSENHPTEKPVSLLKRIIEVTTIKDQLIVDPFGGVASTLVAAKESGRRFWGCEIDENYHEIGRMRLAT